MHVILLNFADMVACFDDDDDDDADYADEDDVMMM